MDRLGESAITISVAYSGTSLTHMKTTQAKFGLVHISSWGPFKLCKLVQSSTYPESLIQHGFSVLSMIISTLSLTILRTGDSTCHRITLKTTMLYTCQRLNLNQSGASPHSRNGVSEIVGVSSSLLSEYSYYCKFCHMTLCGSHKHPSVAYPIIAAARLQQLDKSGAFNFGGINASGQVCP